MKRTFLTILLCLVVFCSLAFAQNEKTGTPGTIKEYSDPSQAIVVKVGERFAIVLDSNATTGYSWQIAKKAFGPLIRFVGKDYMAPRTKLAGAGGKERWTFTAESAGKGTLTFSYARSWEKDKEPARTMTFKVVAQ